MKRVHSRLSIAFFFAALLGSGAASQSADASGNGDDDGGCKKVHGKFTAQNLPPTECSSPVGFCTEGELQGNLKGTYAFVMSAVVPVDELDAPTVTFFKGDSTVTTKTGHVLTGIDTGAINLEAPGLLNSGRFSTLLTFTDGGAGHLWIHGTADLVGGTVAGSYSGLVCAE